MKRIVEPTSSLDQDRALKYFLLRTQLFLRGPGRGGRRGRLVVLQRLSAWNDGEQGKLIKWWQRDVTDRLNERSGVPRLPPSDAKIAKHTCKLLAQGKMSAAVRLATSDGNADINDPDVLDKELAE